MEGQSRVSIIVENNIFWASGKRLKLDWRSRGNLELRYIYGFGRTVLLFGELF